MQDRAGRGDDGAATLRILNAQQSLLIARNGLADSFFNYEQQRIRLLINSEKMQLDARGFPTDEYRSTPVRSRRNRRRARPATLVGRVPSLDSPGRAGSPSLSGAGFAALEVRPAAPDRRSGKTDRPVTATIARGELKITITDRGELESIDAVQVMCDLKGGGKLVSIIDEGKRVRKGDEVARSSTPTSSPGSRTSRT